MSRHAITLDWPDNLDRTPAAQRERNHKFSATIADTTQALAREMDLMDDCQTWHGSIANGHSKSNGLPLHNASPDDPGFVLRWTTTSGNPHAVACDRYTDLSSNLRAVFLWVRETRKRSQRPVETGASNFAAAALPSGDDNATIAPAPPEREPHSVLEVSPDAGVGVVEAAARSKKAAAHPDSDGDSEWTIDEVERAKEAMLDGD